MTNVRKEWLDALLKIVSPVLDALEKGELKKQMPLSFHKERSEFAPLEAFGRGMLGLAPWLETESEELEGEEKTLQKKYRDKALAEGLPSEVRSNLAKAFRSSRQISAGSTNWLFFSAMVEAGLYVLGEPCDMMRVLYALRVFQGWYKGDGVYGDGVMLHCDYYNSFVIQPMYVDLVKLFADKNPEIEAMRGTVIARAARYASVLERMIGPEGSYPVVGRSICYRFGAFQMLSQAALQHELEEGISPASVRCGLTAVIRRVMSAPDMFDEKGWLLPGVYGHQPELAEGYINIGSLYLCSAVFLPLGLSPRDDFWSGVEEDWSGKKVWSGGHITIDHAED